MPRRFASAFEGLAGRRPVGFDRLIERVDRASNHAAAPRARGHARRRQLASGDSAAASRSPATNTESISRVAAP